MALCGTSNGFTVVRWEYKGFKKIVRLDILSTVTNLFVGVKNLNYVFVKLKTNEDFLCNGGCGYSHIKKKGQICPLFILV